MEDQQLYEIRRGEREDLDGSLGEDGPDELGGEVQDRGLFGRRHRHGSGYDPEAEAYASEIGGGYGVDGLRPPPPPGAVIYEADGGGYGKGFESRPPPPELLYESGGGGGYYGEGYAGDSYGRRPAAPVYVEPAEVSDLGTGLLDSHIRTEPDYGSGYGHSDLTGAYAEERWGRHDGRGHYGVSKEDREELDDERKHKHIAEAAAAAAIGYGLYQCHEKNDAEEKLEELGYDSDGKKKHDHHLFRDD